MEVKERCKSPCRQAFAVPGGDSHDYKPQPTSIQFLDLTTNCDDLDRLMRWLLKYAQLSAGSVAGEECSEVSWKLFAI